MDAKTSFTDVDSVLVAKRVYKHRVDISKARFSIHTHSLDSRVTCRTRGRAGAGGYSPSSPLIGVSPASPRFSPTSPAGYSPTWGGKAKHLRRETTCTKEMQDLSAARRQEAGEEEKTSSSPASCLLAADRSCISFVQVVSLRRCFALPPQVAGSSRARSSDSSASSRPGSSD
jgi:hypothetical protein